MKLLENLQLKNLGLQSKFKSIIVAGIDEAGRGCLAGPVVSACLAINFSKSESFPKKFFEVFSEVRDSKQLSKTKRKKLFEEICSLQSQELVHFGIGIVAAEIIDQINILNATKQSMYEAYLDLRDKHKIFAEEILVDGNFVPFLKQDKINSVKAIIGGDVVEPLISAASIIAKVWRDSLMKDFTLKYPQFGFEKHYGYGTKFHVEKIKKFGPSKIHRLSFEPIKSMILK
jgi:ribonuclease HII